MTFAQILLRVRPVELAALIKRLSGIERREITINGCTHWVDPASTFGNAIISGCVYEPALVAALSKELKTGDVFLDLGANEGYFSLIASRLVGKHGHVFAIEPQRRLWHVIIQNFVLNSSVNYTLIPYAIGPTQGRIELLLFPDINTGATSATGSFRRKLFRRQVASALPLSEIFGRYNISKVELMKIDIEGYELYALKSLGHLLNTGVIRKIIVELHPKQLELQKQSAAEIEALLVQSGYCRRHSNNEISLWERM